MATDHARLRIGNASGFYGDRFSAVREMLEGGPLNVLTGDYLAELTMLILGRGKLKDPDAGYATTFLRQMEDTLGLAAERGVKIVTNAGGLNPAGLAAKLTELAAKLGIEIGIAHVEGDDLLARAAELGLDQGPHGAPLTANAYLGAWGIAECLKAGAGVVVTGRVTDASLVVGPAAAHFGWQRDDLDALAGATVAGHVLECGAQATGGNYSFFTEVYNVKALGFPIAEVHNDGSSVITKHEGTGGAVTVETVTAQLLYEIGEPAYLSPDVTTHFDTVRLTQEAEDRVRIEGVRGTPPPSTTKVCLNHLGGFRNEMTFVLTGLDIDAKAAWVKAQLESALPVRPAHLEWILARTDHPDAATEQEASALLRCVVKDPDQKAVGRAFSSAAVELALASYPGFTMTAPPANGTPYGVYTPAYVRNEAVPHTAILPNGTRLSIPPSSPAEPAQGATAAHLTPSAIAAAPADPVHAATPATAADPAASEVPAQAAARAEPARGAAPAAYLTPAAMAAEPATPVDRAHLAEQVNLGAGSGANAGQPTGSMGGDISGKALEAFASPRVDLPEAYDLGAKTRTVPLGAVAGARSGDKGGDANIGVWARTDEQWRWLVHFLTAEKLTELLPETQGRQVTRHVLNNLRAVNFVIEGLLQEGVAASTRFDPQGKALGEWLRSRTVDIPEALL